MHLQFDHYAMLPLNTASIAFCVINY